MAALEAANGEGAAALRRAASPLGGRRGAAGVRRSRLLYAAAAHTAAAEGVGELGVGSVGARARARSRSSSPRSLPQAALQAATERVAALETANEILRSQVAFLGASAEDSKNFIVSSK